MLKYLRTIFIIAIVTFSFCLSVCHGQRDTIFLDSRYAPVDNIEKARYYQFSEYNEAKKNYTHYIFTYRDHKLSKQVVSASKNLKDPYLLENIYDPSGRLIIVNKMLNDSTHVKTKYDASSIPIYKIICNGRYYNGQGIWYDTKGDTLSIVEYKNGQEYNGLFPFDRKEMQYVDARVNEDRFRNVNDGKIEKIIYKYSNGKIAVEEYVEFIKRKLFVKRANYYFNSGELIGSCDFEKGKPLNGIQGLFSNKSNRSNGPVALFSLSKFEHGILVEQLVYDNDQKEITKATYKNSKIYSGTIYERHQDVDSIVRFPYMRLMHFDKGIHVGVDSFYSLESVLLMDVEISEEKLHGKANVYSTEDGKIISEGKFVNGKPFEGLLFAIYKYSYKKLPVLANYIQGDIQGESLVEIENGILRLE